MVFTEYHCRFFKLIILKFIKEVLRKNWFFSKHHIPSNMDWGVNFESFATHQEYFVEGCAEPLICILSCRNKLSLSKSILEDQISGCCGIWRRSNFVSCRWSSCVTGIPSRRGKAQEEEKNEKKATSVQNSSRLNLTLSFISGLRNMGGFKN